MVTEDLQLPWLAAVALAEQGEIEAVKPMEGGPGLSLVGRNEVWIVTDVAGEEPWNAEEAAWLAELLLSIQRVRTGKG